MKTIRANSGQTIEDIALQEYGSVEGAILILMDNSLSPDTELYPGQLIQVRSQVPELTAYNHQVQKEYERKGYKPNSGVIGAAPQTGYVLDGYVDTDYVEE